MSEKTKVELALAIYPDNPALALEIAKNVGRPFLVDMFAVKQAGDVNAPNVDIVDNNKGLMAIGDQVKFANAKQGKFKEFKASLRRDHKCAPDNGSHDKTTRVTVWYQRRNGKARLASRAKLAQGEKYAFAYTSDYKHVIVERQA